MKGAIFIMLIMSLAVVNALPTVKTGDHVKIFDSSGMTEGFVIHPHEMLTFANNPPKDCIYLNVTHSEYTNSSMIIPMWIPWKDITKIEVV